MSIDMFDVNSPEDMIYGIFAAFGTRELIEAGIPIYTYVKNSKGSWGYVPVRFSIDGGKLYVQDNKGEKYGGVEGNSIRVRLDEDEFIFNPCIKDVLCLNDRKALEDYSQEHPQDPRADQVPYVSGHKELKGSSNRAE